MQYKVYNNILRKTKGFAEKFIGDVVAQDAQDAKPAPSSSATSWGALRAVYANAELLRLQVFEKFDEDSNLIIDRTEVTSTIVKLLRNEKLDDRSVFSQPCQVCFVSALCFAATRILMLFAQHVASCRLFLGCGPKR